MDALVETLKGLKINDAESYESDSGNTNDAKDDPASDLKTVTHISDGNKIKVADTSNGDLQQTLLINRNLPIIPATIHPRIDDRVATCGLYTHKVVIPQTTKVITDIACSRARGLRTKRPVNPRGRVSSTPGNSDISVSSSGLTPHF